MAYFRLTGDTHKVVFAAAAAKVLCNAAQHRAGLSSCPALGHATCGMLHNCLANLNRKVLFELDGRSLEDFTQTLYGIGTHLYSLTLSPFVCLFLSLFPYFLTVFASAQTSTTSWLKAKRPFQLGLVRFGTVRFPCPLIVSLCARSSRHRASAREPNLALCPGVHGARGCMLWHVLACCCCSSCCCGMRSRLCCSLSSLRLSVIISCAVLTAHIQYTRTIDDIRVPRLQGLCQRDDSERRLL